MKIKVTDLVLDYNGKPLESSEGPLSVRVVFNQALNSVAPNETLTAEQKSKIFGLSLKIFGSDEVNITSDEAALIKERVGVIYTSPLVYGRVCELLDK